MVIVGVRRTFYRSLIGFVVWLEVRPLFFSANGLETHTETPVIVVRCAAGRPRLAGRFANGRLMNVTRQVHEEGEDRNEIEGIGFRRRRRVDYDDGVDDRGNERRPRP